MRPLCFASTASRDPSTINWWIVAGAAVAFVAFGWWVRRWFTRRTASR
jgi:hypothetical protein